ncbi:MAG: carbamoyltransferase HypF [Chloroflexota bacterium]
MISEERASSRLSRSRLVITGIVQGVGFRPFIHRLANSLGLNGWVLNSTEGVVLEVEGKSDIVDRFVQAIPAEAPSRARIERIDRVLLPPIGYSSFSIEESQEAEGQFALVSPDICICDDCLRELRDPADRRYRYPFINCTNCGPRFTIVADVPYDRPKTTMGCFTMCPECEREYHDPSARRFHAQPNACPVCGPHAWLVVSKDAEAGGRGDGPHPQPLPHGERGDTQHSTLDSQNSELRTQNPEPSSGPRTQDSGLTVQHSSNEGGSYEAIRQARLLLKQGAILAVKGLGGFHLACDATNEEAVAELRRRKRRSDKPFAIMALDADTVATFCHLSDDERQLLESPQRPIVLLRRKEGGTIAPSVAPHNRFLGVMLPYTPLHYLLIGEGLEDVETRGQGDGPHPLPLPRRERGDTQHSTLDSQNSELRTQNPEPSSGRRTQDAGLKLDSAPSTRHSGLILVMTSGNLSEEPIATGNREALERLDSLADAFLFHNRDIQIRCDDSVTRVFRGQESVSRRSRGYAPFPVRLGFELRDLLACGGELKNSFCITKGSYAFLSQHIGDLENAETLQSFAESVEHFRRLFRLEIEAVAHDLHPEYLSTRYAWELAGGESNLPLVPVQHHHAHVAACMAENGVDGKVLGVSFDGTGYGDDGRLWGGEFLVCDYSGYHRAAHFKYVPLPGGEAAIKRPYRMATAYLMEAFGSEHLCTDLHPLRQMDSTELAVLARQVQRNVNSPLTSSVGRLFDAVSSLIGIRQVVNYEGQAAIELEMVTDDGIEDGYEWTLLPGDPGIIDPAPIIRQIVDELRKGVTAERISARFHNTVAEIIDRTCLWLRKETDLWTVALSGGVFQNLFLLERTCRRLENSGFRVLIHHQVPTNDGGISLGQAVIANRILSAGFRD